MVENNKLYYVYDPMCSWCWGFKPIWKTIEETLSDELDITYVLGGLAADTDVVMPLEMQRQIALYWKKIEQYLGTKFNYEFWEKNTPRRATYPSCRAILAARSQGAEREMLGAIQQAYYLQAKNPSDNEVLIALAESINIDVVAFSIELQSKETQIHLEEEIAFAREIGGNSFPSLFVKTEKGVTPIPIDYQDAQSTIDLIRRQIK